MANEFTVVRLIVLVVAAAAGWALAGRITRPLVRLTGLAEQISARGGVRGPDVEALNIPVKGTDKVGRLSASLTAMVERLAATRDGQNRLVQDAAHELRSPLTSLRTNTSVLRRFVELSHSARERLICDVQGETRELSHLVDELVELAFCDASEEAEVPVALADVARAVAVVAGDELVEPVAVPAEPPREQLGVVSAMQSAGRDAMVSAGHRGLPVQGRAVGWARELGGGACCLHRP